MTNRSMCVICAITGRQSRFTTQSLFLLNCQRLIVSSCSVGRSTVLSRITFHFSKRSFCSAAMYSNVFVIIALL